MPSRAQYYWRQADICMRLSLLSDNDDVAELLITKAMELMSQAESAASEDERTTRLNGHHRRDEDEPH
jgi:hypothetical protein